jgi:glyoxylase-like metal-dependent hydrolase (beta-lactamase superfamily II)
MLLRHARYLVAIADQAISRAARRCMSRSPRCRSRSGSSRTRCPRRTLSGERQMDSPWKKAFIIEARKNLLPVRDRLIFFKDEREFLPGITAIAAPGHTLGHAMFNVRSNGQSCFFVGDVSHHSVLLIENPRMKFLYDTDAKQAVKTRLKMLSSLAENRIPILAYHFAYGHFVKQGEGFRYLPAAMNMNL